MAEAGVQLRFWGVRGSTPTPQRENLKFGGNTACIEIRTTSGPGVIFDAGSGIRNLGNLLAGESNGSPISTHIFLTHYHWDHIQGIPFFAPLYGKQNEIIFHGAKRPLAMREILEGQMSKPYFPVDFTQVAAHRDFIEFEIGDTLEAGGLIIRPFALNHPQTASGYRIEVGGKVIVYATDYEHGHDLDRSLAEHAKGADILICDSQYTAEEYATHRGWGHSTPENAACVAQTAGAKSLILFHHDPGHDDYMMERINREARVRFENTVAAWEGYSTIL